MLTDVVRSWGLALRLQEGGRRTQLPQLPLPSALVSEVLPQNHLNHPHSHSREKAQKEPLH